MPAQSATALAVTQNAIHRTAASDLPVKWCAEAPVAPEVLTYAEAIAAFRKEFELNRLGIVQTFHSRTSRFAVYGCKIAVEYSNRNTLHLRMRPPGSPWLLTAATVSAWPELNSCIRFRSLDRSWLRVALANIFEAWSQSWLPAGYRYANPLEAVDSVLRDFLDEARLAQQWARALAGILPREFLRVLGLMPVPLAALPNPAAPFRIHIAILVKHLLAALPNPAAPFRIWNRHSAELEQPHLMAPWLLQIAPVFRYFPAELAPGLNLEHSLRIMVVQRHSPTVWRFHRRTEFALVPGGDLLVHQGADVASAMVTGAVKGLGLENAAAFLMSMGTERFTRMYIHLNEYGSMRDWVERLPLFMARAARRLKEAGEAAEREHAMEEIVMVLRGLARVGFFEGFPVANSTWISLLQRADAWNAPPAGEAEDHNLPTSWEVCLPRWEYGEVQFSALTSLSGLRAEGVEMFHCVESRFFDCASGSSVVYRIQGSLPDRQPVRATVEFSRTRPKRPDGGVRGKWNLSEIRGRFNAEVDPAVRRIALIALAALNRSD